NPYPSVDARELSESPVVKELKKYTTAGERMVVWGWQPRYYVEAQLPQGTAELNSERCIFEHPMREVYRERYMRDLKRNRPTVFIDAVGKNSVWVQDTLTQSYRSFPELATYIDQNYTMKSTYDG